jgi:AcrR family transcriptional regulator
MKRGAYAKTAERRRTILATALEVFAESGFRGASIREIASRVGMTDTGVLHHFGGKSKLLLEVVKQKEDEDAGTLRDPYLRDLVARNAARRGTVRLFTTLSAESTDPEHPAHEHFVNRYASVRKLVADRLDGETAAGRMPSTIDPGIAARITIAVMDGLQIQWLLDPSLEMEVAYNDFIEHYFGAPTGPDDQGKVTPAEGPAIATFLGI